MADSNNPTAGAPAAARGCFLCNVAMPFLEQLCPAEAGDHFRSSRVEFLKGIRSLLDDRIARMSPEEHMGTHVTVE